jgi:hypothetical protein
MNEWLNGLAQMGFSFVKNLVGFVISLQFGHTGLYRFAEKNVDPSRWNVRFQHFEQSLSTGSG